MSLYTYMYVRMTYITDTININIEAENLIALSSVYQSDYSLVESSTLQCCIVHDGASADRADKCSISSYYLNRKRYLALHRTTTDKQCKYVVNNYVHTMW